MAQQSQRGGGTWSRYMSNPAFRIGYLHRMEGMPFDYDVATTLGVRDTPTWEMYKKAGIDYAAQLQRHYEAGRLMAAESGLALPAKAKRQTKEIMSVVRACPAMCKLFATEQANARQEARMQASLRMKLRHLDNAKRVAA